MDAPGSASALRKRLERLAQLFRDEPQQAARRGSLRLLRRIASYFGPHRRRIAWAMASMLVVAMATAASAYLIKPALDDIFINKNRSALLLVPALFIAVMALKGVGRFVQNYLMNTAGLLVLEKLRLDLYERMISLPVRFFEDNQVGMLMSRIITDVMMMRQALPSIIQLVRQVLTMAALVGVVFWQDAFLAFWAVIVLPLAIWPFVYFSRKLRTLSRGSQARMAGIAAFLQEAFSGVRVVKAFAGERREAARFGSEHEELVRLALKESAVNELSSPIMELVGALGMGLVIWYGGSRVIAGESTPGTFFSFLAGLILLYDPVKKLNTANRDIQQALAGAERVFDILDSPELAPEQGGDLDFPTTFTGLEFQHVGFAYAGAETPALADLDLRVEPGQRLAIVGPSGAGKSTLVNLIPAFYRPTSGRILLAGHDLRDYRLSSLRPRIGMVSQEAFLFNMSVAANIAYGGPAVDMDRVEAAARAAYAHDFILGLPQGYDTVVGERGVKLSGGQRQRLTIARALYTDPPLLILDEATSALDSESERIVQQALDNLMQGRTSIVIAHRLSTILSADVIVVLEAGRMVGKGRHQELLADCPLYAHLYRMQFGDGTGAPVGQGRGT